MTWDLLLGKSTEQLRLNPGKSWYQNLEEVIADGDYRVTFRLKRPSALVHRSLGLRLVGGLPLSRVAA